MCRSLMYVKSNILIKKGGRDTCESSQQIGFNNGRAAAFNGSQQQSDSETPKAVNVTISNPTVIQFGALHV